MTKLRQKVQKWCVSPLCSSSGHAPSPSVEQPGVEPRLQSDPQRLLGGDAHPVAAAGLTEHNIQALAEGGCGVATQACRDANR